MYADVDVKTVSRGVSPARVCSSPPRPAPTGTYPLLGYSWSRMPKACRPDGADNIRRAVREQVKFG
jgi:hypothetical protein